MAAAAYSCPSFGMVVTQEGSVPLSVLLSSLLQQAGQDSTSR